LAIENATKYERFGEKARRGIDGTTNEPNRAGMTRPGIKEAMRVRTVTPNAAQWLDNSAESPPEADLSAVLFGGRSN
jgi:hypothetical protein